MYYPMVDQPKTIRKGEEKSQYPWFSDEQRVPRVVNDTNDVGLDQGRQADRPTTEYGINSAILF